MKPTPIVLQIQKKSYLSGKVNLKVRAKINGNSVNFKQKLKKQIQVEFSEFQTKILDLISFQID